MNRALLIILIHQVVFQGMFFAKNILLRKRLGQPIRGKNQEANIAIGFFSLFILVSFLAGLLNPQAGTLELIAENTAQIIALVLLALNVWMGAASLTGLGDSWRVGVLENQQTDLVDQGVYRFSRNPYFLSYMIMLAAYTILLQNLILLGLSLIGVAIIHAMVLKEEKHLVALHGEKYRQYRKTVPRYMIV